MKKQNSPRPMAAPTPSSIRARISPSASTRITGGKKVPVVYDSVGKDTFLKSLDCLAPLGVAALFGASSGNVEPLNLGLLAQKGSLYVTSPSLNTYAAKHDSLVAMAKEL